MLLGEFTDTLGASVQTLGAGDDLKLSVHRNPRTGRRACVLVNSGEASREAVVGFQPETAHSARIYRPFEATVTGELPVRLAVVPGRVAVVMEE
ncbi:MAG: hypothetical protein HYY08_03560 [Firmicutes bacterium]|nr:hypothetical protein [Bacillota bacterium]